MLTLKITELSGFNLIYADMKLQFPEHELKSYEYFMNLLETGYYQAYKIIDADTDIGYVLIYNNKTQNKLWLDYFAVYREFHSQGYGRKILDLLKNEFPTHEGIYLEVEKPDKNNHNTFRRIKFYKNNGAKLCPINYIYPARSGGFPMDLYFLSFQGKLPEKNDILADVKKTLQTLHKHNPYLEKITELIN